MCPDVDGPVTVNPNQETGGPGVIDGQAEQPYVEAAHGREEAAGAPLDVPAKDRLAQGVRLNEAKGWKEKLLQEAVLPELIKIRRKGVPALRSGNQGCSEAGNELQQNRQGGRIDVVDVTSCGRGG
ncbi:hypothetical protein AAU01_22690 [Paenarthrobacter aurescens]|uniref:Uncharacterized protein n=1 Tax=Paenarthrobacter aurescens TaxID=43663 RepID=A0A4Y3NC45_PAEAU|nr:hypothetical protein AAU01_22690 [Paenarthrobacter aurescens]